ncbi:lysylphosphatidylglycerol synthetase-like protein (DUF2156 family) [Paenarthrobacter nicotinovorans]|uniref:hypothetical protein n=1 Tax=Micrococcaceae TaxID=1268 RepID=UPI001113CFF0|nr:MULTISPECIES: hypothetical protein [Micrococcaceae]MDR6439096.1 lysylphosphatidylglycerol synthetase-like protein (DUF2156 family) [Paenarthrobacter nicotinovorans]
MNLVLCLVRVCVAGSSFRQQWSGSLGERKSSLLWACFFFRLGHVLLCGVHGYSCDMNNQGKLFKISGLVAIAGIVLSIIMMIAFGRVTGGAVAVLTTALVILLVVGAVAICIALAAYREQGRKPGSTPLIYAVISFPLGWVLVFVYAAAQFPPLMLIALVALVTSVPALIIGIVKKLSVKAAPVVAITPEAGP